MLHLNNNKVGKVYLGDTPISKIYRGDTLIYQATPSISTFTIVNSVTSTLTLRLNANSILWDVQANTPSTIDITEVRSMAYMFQDCKNLISVDLSNFNTKDVTSMSMTFYGCSSLTSLDLSNFNTSKVSSMESMFRGCSSLTSLDLSNFDASLLKYAYSMRDMFLYCGKLVYIKCKQAFKDWCWQNAGTISLPEQMREGGTGTWEIVN